MGVENMSSQARAEKQTSAKVAPSKQAKAVPKIDVPAEQMAYANLLLYCSWAGIAMLALTFLIYMSGLLSPFIPASEMPMYWGMSAHDFLAETGAPIGWGWLGMLGYGDFINLIGIAFLALLTIVGYLVLLLPAYFRKKDVAYTSIVVVEILVLSLAASGILAVGAH